MKLKAHNKALSDFVKAKNDSLLREVADKVAIKEIDFGSLERGEWGGVIGKTKANIIALFRELEAQVRSR